jgi:hypothetical protein
MNKLKSIGRYFLMLAAAVTAIAGPATAQTDAQALCGQYNLPNVDCACVSKRYDAYMKAAQTAEYRKMVDASYRYALGAGGDFIEMLKAMYDDIEMTFNYQQRFESISGSEPDNIDDFFAGCAIKGAPLAPLPALSSQPIHQKLYKACMDFYPDQRSCQCQAAQIADATTIPEAKAYYYSFNEKGNGSFKEQQRLSAEKAGLSLNDFFAADKRARSKIGDNYEGSVQCGILRWADGREGRTAEERAGVPQGFENYQAPDKIETLADIQREQQDAADFARQQAAQTPMPDQASINAIIASAKAEQAAMEKKIEAEKARGAQLTSTTTPRAALDKGCAANDNEPAVCDCIGGVFDAAVKSSGASRGAAMQLAILMSGGAIGDADATAMIRSGNQQDLAVAGQLFAQNMMGIIGCQ